MVNLGEKKIGFLGLGKMGGAIARGLRAAHSDVVLYGYDPHTASPAVTALASSQDLEEKSDVILLCVKPQEMKSALSHLKGTKQYISIAAGVSTAAISGFLQGSRHVARAMPNLAAAIHKSATGVYSSDPELAVLARSVFETVGVVEVVEKEDLLHVVTGLSGSGPAFVFEFLDALAQGAVLSGLSYDRAVKLAAQTLIGAAHLVAEEKKHPLELRSQVTSPGGTTISGLAALEEGGFRSAVIEAVRAASARSVELGKG